MNVYTYTHTYIQKYNFIDKKMRCPHFANDIMHQHLSTLIQ